MRRVRRFAVTCSLATIGLLGAAVLTESLLEVRDAKHIAASQTFVDVGGAHVRYRLVGGGQPGAPVVLLTGMSGTIEQWDHVQTSIGTTVPALAYDRAGYGFSRGSSAHDALQQADELADLLSALGLDRRVILVGFSTGASIARVFIGRYREKVAGLVLAAPYLPEIEGRIEGRHSPRRTYARWLLHESVTTLFGLKRLAAMLPEQRGRIAGSSPVEQRATVILMRFGHWWAVDREWLSIPQTTRQVLTADGLHDLPIILLSDATASPGNTRHIAEEVNREFVARSNRGSLRSFGAASHGILLDQGAEYQILIDAIRDMVKMTR